MLDHAGTHAVPLCIRMIMTYDLRAKRNHAGLAIGLAIDEQSEAIGGVFLAIVPFEVYKISFSQYQRGWEPVESFLFIDIGK